MNFDKYNLHVNPRRKPANAALASTPRLLLIGVVVAIVAASAIYGASLMGAASGSAVTSASTSSTTSSAASLTATTTAGHSVIIKIVSGAHLSTQSDNFVPSRIVVILGVNNTVVWTNNDNSSHTVTSYTGLFSSGNVNPANSWNYTFIAAGNYTYHCSYHPWMKGTIIVLANPQSASANTASNAVSYSSQTTVSNTSSSTLTSTTCIYYGCPKTTHTISTTTTSYSATTTTCYYGCVGTTHSESG